MASTSIKVINNTGCFIFELVMKVLGISVWTERDINPGETRSFPCEWVWYSFDALRENLGLPRWLPVRGEEDNLLIVYGDSTVTLTACADSHLRATQARTRPAPSTVSALYMDQTLSAGQALHSHDGRIKLIYQTDGNLVLLRGDSTVLWHAGTHGTVPGKVIMQTDGNLVVYDASGKAAWASSFNGGSWGPGPEFRDSRLVCQHDGNLVVYAKDDAVLWQTNTRG